MADAREPGATQDARGGLELKEWTELSTRFWRLDLSNALLLIAALLLGMYSVIRPVAFQWSPWSAESAMAGITASLFVLAAWGVSAVYARRAGWLPDGVVAALVLWLGLHVLGLFRSPYLGAGMPAAAEAGIDVALLVAAFMVARAWPGFVSGAVRLLVAAGVLETLLGFWQKFHDLPELRRIALQKTQVLPDILFTQQGQERLFSEEIFGTFGNANSYAGFLLVTIFLQLGVWLDARERCLQRPRDRLINHAGHGVCLAVQLAGLYVSGSKGAGIAAMAGGWFLLAQLLATTPLRTRLLTWVTGLGVTAMAAILWLGAAGPLRWLPFPLSLQVRFEYWLTGWGMVREQPWLGIGLGGFSEAYPQYKTVLAGETMLAHNDYLQLWAELGVLAPIAWLLLWFVVLRPRKVASQNVSAQPVIAEASNQHLSDEQVRTRVLGYLLLAGGVVGSLFMMFCFGRMHGNYFYRYFSEGGAHEVRTGALAAIITPLLYAGAFLLLLQPRQVAVMPPGERLWLGVRAAVGAVLVHQLVDFDMTAQAIMAWIFLLGGFLLAQARDEERPGWLARSARWAPPFLIAAVSCGAIVCPLFSGQERDNAHGLEDLLRETRVRLQSVELKEQDRVALQETIAKVYEDMVRAQEHAVQWAPYDGSASLELALGYLQLWRNGKKEWQPLGRGESLPLRQLMEECLADTQRLRPRWHGGRLVAGHFLLEWGADALRRGRSQEAAGLFRKAELEYRAGVALYPGNPSSRLVCGDAMLFQGNVAGAAEAYRDAWELDRSILDANVRFASIFHDPLPGCLIKHGRDLEVQERLSAELARPELDLEVRRGLLVRQLLVAAWRLLGAPKTGRETELEQLVMRSWLIQACETLSEVAPEDGHAAAFRAWALKRFYKPELAPQQQLIRAQLEWAPLAVAVPGAQAWSSATGFVLLRELTRAQGSWKQACELQQKSITRGRPDTQPQVFEELRLRLGLPQGSVSK